MLSKDRSAEHGGPPLLGFVWWRAGYFRNDPSTGFNTAIRRYLIRNIEQTLESVRTRLPQSYVPITSRLRRKRWSLPAQRQATISTRFRPRPRWGRRAVLV